MRNRASYVKLRAFYGSGERTVSIFTNRATVALLSLKNKVVCWPDVTEREPIKNRIRRKSRFPNCTGVLDESSIPLKQKPTLHGEDYFDQKKQNSIASLAVADDQKRIRYNLCGFVGSSRDSRVFTNSKSHTSRMLSSKGTSLFWQNAQSSIAGQ